MLLPILLAYHQEQQQAFFQLWIAQRQLHDSIRTRNYLQVNDLQHPDDSAWHHLYKNGSDSALVNMISLDKGAFNSLLARFELHYEVLSGPGRRGRPRKLESKSTVLGLILSYYTSTMEYKSLSPATLSRTITQAETSLASCLKEIPEAKVIWPSFQQQRDWSALTQAKYPSLCGRWGFVDGKNYKVQKPTDADVQNAQYNGKELIKITVGWLHATLITGVVLYGVDGTAVWIRHNCPGSWNDGEMSRGMREKLIDPLLTVAGTGVVSDSAFPVSGALICNYRRDGRSYYDASENRRLGSSISSTKRDSGREKYRDNLLASGV